MQHADFLPGYWCLTAHLVLRPPHCWGFSIIHHYTQKRARANVR